MLVFFLAASAGAREPAAPTVQPALHGLYRIRSSTDPAFPLDNNQDWFFDFAHGADSSSGTLALTLRQNPNLRVRLLVWQFFPDSATLRLGRASARSSHEAITAATWQLARGAAGSLLLRRGAFQITLAPATLAE